jgi:hypothetical protein
MRKLLIATLMLVSFCSKAETLDMDKEVEQLTTEDRVELYYQDDKQHAYRDYDNDRRMREKWEAENPFSAAFQKAIEDLRK